MTAHLLILPGVITSDEEASLLAMPGSEWSRLVGLGEAARLEPSDESRLRFDAIGLGQDVPDVPGGPLWVAGLGHDPPANSVHFRADLLSFTDGKAEELPTTVEEELGPILVAAKRLNTRALTFLPGFGCHHALVWEGGSTDLGTLDPTELKGRIWKDALPKGDGEPLLRRFIDDSINLLTDLEVNRQRVGEGKSPINLIWPYAAGFRPLLPNLALRRGQPVTLMSRDFAMAGLAKLVGYRHDDISRFGAILRPNFDAIQAAWQGPSSSVVILDDFAILRARRGIDEARWLWKELDGRLWRTVRPAAETPELQILLPSTTGGLVLRLNAKTENGRKWPFDERLLVERIPRLRLNETTSTALTDQA